MADIFLTYSKKHAALTEELARDLQAAGYSTWWDTRLLGEEGNFPERIRSQILAAKTVIVIWSEHSVTSPWVYAEANEGYLHGKLLQVRDEAFDRRKVPVPFTAGTVFPLTGRGKILRALTQPGSWTKPPRGADYLYNLELDFADATHGCKRRVQLGNETIDVFIPAGVRNGQTLRLRHKGGPGAREAGDVLVKLTVRSPNISLRGMDYHYVLELDFQEAMDGCQKELKVFDNETVKIVIPAGAADGQVLRLKHRGGPGISEAGDVLVTLKIRPKRG